MRKILIANRGEIAVRVIKTAKKMGIKTVAIYASVDRSAPHVKMADEAVHIGNNPSSESYLLGDKIIKVAKRLNADAIHPGYGFLSENADFADKVEQSGLIFIGPRSSSIRMMGDKLAAKTAVKDYNIPMVPGTDTAILSTKEAIEVANAIGYPVLIKASAGGGGKGMRIVKNEDSFAAEMERAVSEATSAFGDGSVFIEKYITSPRHIEIQILADSHGNIVHLFERECSIQRRHQKVVEESPSSVLTNELRTEMGNAALKVAKSCNYLGAGTVEFLLDENLNFHFLEMNTRLQVEHPVTEFITGIDLVEEQINIARGHKLSFIQKDIQMLGHSFELRVYAEDSLNDFLPNVGVLKNYQIPIGKNIRVDDGYENGMEIPIYYDPLISKLISYGKNREEAIEVMLQAIDHYKIEGVLTTLDFGRFVFENEAFKKGNFDTHFVKKYYNTKEIDAKLRIEAELAAIIGLKLYLQDQKVLRIPTK